MRSLEIRQGGYVGVSLLAVWIFPTEVCSSLEANLHRGRPSIVRVLEEFPEYCHGREFEVGNRHH